MHAESSVCVITHTSGASSSTRVRNRILSFRFERGVAFVILPQLIHINVHIMQSCMQDIFTTKMFSVGLLTARAFSTVFRRPTHSRFHWHSTISDDTIMQCEKMSGVQRVTTKTFYRGRFTKGMQNLRFMLHRRRIQPRSACYSTASKENHVYRFYRKRNRRFAHICTHVCLKLPLLRQMWSSGSSMS